MLFQVLREIEQANGPVTVNELSQKLGIDQGVLTDMIQYWVRKGKLRGDGATAVTPHTAVHHCGSSCAGPSTCNFIAKMPKTYTVPVHKLK